MAALSCTGLPVSSASPSSYSSPHATEGSSNTPHLASLSCVALSRHARSPSLALGLACASSSSLAGSSLNLAFRQTARRQVDRSSGKVASTRCESTSEGGTKEKVLSFLSFFLPPHPNFGDILHVRFMCSSVVIGFLDTLLGLLHAITTVNRKLTQVLTQPSIAAFSAVSSS